MQGIHNTTKLNYYSTCILWETLNKYKEYIIQQNYLYSMGNIKWIQGIHNRTKLNYYSTCILWETLNEYKEYIILNLPVFCGRPWMNIRVQE